MFYCGNLVAKKVKHADKLHLAAWKNGNFVFIKTIFNFLLGDVNNCAVLKQKL